MCIRDRPGSADEYRCIAGGDLGDVRNIHDGLIHAYFPQDGRLLPMEQHIPCLLYTSPCQRKALTGMETTMER